MNVLFFSVVLNKCGILFFSGVKVSPQTFHENKIQKYIS